MALTTSATFTNGNAKIVRFGARRMNLMKDVGGVMKADPDAVAQAVMNAWIAGIKDDYNAAQTAKKEAALAAAADTDTKATILATIGDDD
jgi:acetylglutamate kinase